RLMLAETRGYAGFFYACRSGGRGTNFSASSGQPFIAVEILVIDFKGKYRHFGISFRRTYTSGEPGANRSADWFAQVEIPAASLATAMMKPGPLRPWCCAA